jgi:hypothetical protein
MLLEVIVELENLFQDVLKLNKTHFPDSKLHPIFGGGCVKNPDYMFCFINPTIRNISSDPNWKGKRYPFIGTKQVWRIFHRAGLFDDTLMKEIEKEKNWSYDLTNRVEKFLEKKKFYFTNIVKWTGVDATLPTKKMIDIFLPSFLDEIKIVKPKTIVTFGLIPFKALTGESIKLKDIYSDFKKTGKIKTFDAHNTKILPSYFPVGRGDPKKAVEILKSIKNW